MIKYKYTSYRTPEEMCLRVCFYHPRQLPKFLLHYSSTTGRFNRQNVTYSAIQKNSKVTENPAWCVLSVYR